jgi:heme O synthase-like polyprenyltransferase
MPVVVMPPGVLGGVYAAIAIVAGAGVLWAAQRMRSRRTDRAAVGLFIATIVYLPVVLIAMVADALAGALPPL